MKKLIAALVSVLLITGLFTACSEPKPTEVRVVSIQNTACISLAQMLESKADVTEGNKYVSTVINLPGLVNLMLSQDECDIALVPAETASLIYQKTNGAVTLLATISTGGYEIVSSDANFSSITNLKGNEISLLERDKIDENLLEYTLSKNGINPAEELSINYNASGVKQLYDEFSEGNVKYALLNSVGAATMLSLDPSLKTVSLSDEWNKISGGVPMVGYCIIVSNDFLVDNKKAVAEFLTDLEASVSAAKQNKAETLALALKHGLLTNEEYGEFIYNSVNIDFTCGEQMKNNLKAYYKVLRGIKTALIGKNAPDDIFYYIPDEE